MPHGFFGGISQHSNKLRQFADRNNRKQIEIKGSKHNHCYADQKPVNQYKIKPLGCMKKHLKILARTV
jgi:hypothetical protein